MVRFGFLGERGGKNEEKAQLDKQASFHRGGTIDDITRQISELDNTLHGYNAQSQLVVDKYLKEQGIEEGDEDEEEFGYGKLKIDYKPHKPRTKRLLTDRETEVKEVNRFAGVYSTRAALQPSSQSPLQNMKETKWGAKIKKSDSNKGMKPMLVELHVFPGYESNELTPLPPPLLANDILMTVMKAQKDLHRKPSYKKYLHSLLLSHMSQAVLQDVFWWYFLERYQSDRSTQELLFNRIAHNYVKLLFNAPITEYRDAFFKRYPDLVNQAVYCTFCTAFPTSYKQFDAKFKEGLVQLVYMWMVGVKPVPRSWERWKLDALEPTDMRKDEKIKKDASKGSLVNLPIDLTEENLSQSSLTKGAKNLPIIVEDRASVMSMRRDMRRKSLFRPSKDNLASRTTMPSENSFLQLPGSSSRLELRNRSSLELSPSSGQDTTGQTTPSVVQSRVSIRESNMTFLAGGNPNKKKRESCPVGRGAQFSRSLFDVHGHSPLVEQFLQMQRLAKNAGTGVLVQRTEIESLPPIDAETYNELIRKSFKLTRQLGAEFRKLDEEDRRKRSQFVKKGKQGYHDYVRRQNELLARQKDVKKISDLLVLELMKDGDEQSSGKAAAAIADAMGFSTEPDGS
ncbi:protein FAM227A isoform X2 [Nematostella vectensis]|uniref:protein FAM227A isoform X2 n=1 Tax=Nematostella vectensis TaxID=45351 RepID=UPI0020774A6F|nr:protein FAM227A isoform X2 [Nematostella vectensis]